MRAPTGDQFELTLSQDGTRSRAIITEVAAALRLLDVDGASLIDSFPEEVTPPFGNGIVLAPWAGRIRDGVWMLDGRRQQLDLTEPGRSNAIHGLLRFRPYRVLDREPHAITLGATIFPQNGYPFIVETSVRYELVQNGLVVTHWMRNDSDSSAPVAVGAHPYFRVGEVPIGELSLRVSAVSRFVADDRMNPIDEVAVERTEFDLRHGSVVRELDLDTAYSGVVHGDDMRARHRLTAPDGRFTEVWQDSSFGFVQVFTPHGYPRPTAADPDAVGQAVAIEPVTAPPDAFNSGVGLRWLSPGEAWSGSWGVTGGRE